MNSLQAFVDAFDSHGGHILICIFLLGIGALFIKLGIPKGDDIIVFSLGVLARSMYGSTERRMESQIAADQTADPKLTGTPVPKP